MLGKITRRRSYEPDRERHRDRDRDQSRLDDPDRRRSARYSPRHSARPHDDDADRQSLDGKRYSPQSSQTRHRPRIYVDDPDMERRGSGASLTDRKPSLPYPGFSKAHSREAVGSREDVANPKPSLVTPDATDLGQQNSDQSPSPKAFASRTRSTAAPPSPPLTNEGPEARRSGSHNGTKQTGTDNFRSEVQKDGVDVDDAPPHDDTPMFSASRSSLREAEEGRSPSNISVPRTAAVRLTPPLGSPRTGTPTHSPPLKPVSQSRTVSGSQQGSLLSKTVTDSDATSVAPDRKTARRRLVSISRSADVQQYDAGWEAETPTAKSFPVTPVTPLEAARRQAVPLEVFTSTESESEADQSARYAFGAPPAPPPPPPPPPPPNVAASEAPRVDYLLQNGGLASTVPKSFSSILRPTAPYASQQNHSPAFVPSQIASLQGVFSPFQKLLDDYSKVLSHHGSIAVATGYRSVARRLLDRLESVFARNISSEICPCIMCRSRRETAQLAKDDTGVSWGEILELVSGRRELPPWPPFSLAGSMGELGISALDRQAPMQKLDIDVPEEFRDHYIRQSKKTKQAVQNWLSTQPQEGPSPPSEVDDDTLTFAMLTYLEPDQRRVFTALVRNLSAIPDPRAPTPVAAEPKSDLMTRMGFALQRLYRLPRPPREPESAMYLLKNPHLHNALATLSAISNQEWDILVSGRFNGFLWSGAEDGHPSTPPSSSRADGVPTPSRTTTPFSTVNGGAIGGGVPLPRGTTPLRMRGYSGQVQPPATPSRGPTPAPGSSSATPGPVQLDEDTEIAALAEVEREIFLGMEALEDAFETLHLKAETIRRELRERGAGLAAAAQSRRASTVGEPIEVRMDTPALGHSGPGWSMWEGNAGLPRPPSASWGDDDDDDGMREDRSELAPDDSASNIGHSGKSSSRPFRHRRRRPRRTPAPVEEEEEAGDSY